MQVPTNVCIGPHSETGLLSTLPPPGALERGHGEPGPPSVFLVRMRPALPASVLWAQKAGHTLLGLSHGSLASGHLRGGSLGRPLSGQTCTSGGQMWSTQMLAHVKGHSALLICTVCLENAPKSKGIEATTTSKVTAHNPGGPGTASASESWALGPRRLASAATSGKVGSVLGSARSTATPFLANGSDDSSPGGRE